MIRWAFFSTLGTLLLFALYRLLFSSDGSLQLRRFYIIMALVFSLLYPMVPMPDFALPTHNLYGEADGFVVAAEPLAANASIGTSATVPNWLMLVYFAGFAVALAVTLAAVLRAWAAVRTMPCRRAGRIRLHRASSGIQSSSFFNHIIIGVDGLDADSMRCVLAHEGEHVRRGHSIDVLVTRLLCCAMWFNILAWLMLRELRVVHECQADAAVLARHPRSAYLAVLYRQAAGFGYGRITNNFKSSNIKKRIMMMNKSKSRFGALKLLAALPLLAALMAVGGYDGTASAQQAEGVTLLEATYHKHGGRQLLLGTAIGYNHVEATLVDQPHWHATVTCSGPGAERSYANYELPAVETSAGLVDGAVFAKIERRMIRSADRRLRRGMASGTLSRDFAAKATEGKVRLVATASWRNGNRAGDADIELRVVEVPGRYAELPDTDPEFPGGVEAMAKYLNDNIVYPDEAKNAGITGQVFAQFVVEKDGSLSNIKVLRGIGGGCDEEVVRVLGAMPRWQPATINGKPVRVQYVVPVLFKL